MQTVTIPKRLTEKGALIVIPRKEYEHLLRVRRSSKASSVSQQQKKSSSQLDRDLNKAIREYKSGKALGPFDSVSKLQGSLEQ